MALISALASDRRLGGVAEWGRIATVVGMLLVLQQLLGRGGDLRRVLVVCFASAIVPLAFAAYQVATGGSQVAMANGSTPRSPMRTRSASTWFSY